MLSKRRPTFSKPGDNIAFSINKRNKDSLSSQSLKKIDFK